MGRVIRTEVVALRCELRSCAVCVAIDPVPLRGEWSAQQAQLDAVVAQGWSVVETPQLRSYCPAHAKHVWQCSCRTNPDRAHLCTVHNAETALLVRSASHTRNPKCLDAAASPAESAVASTVARNRRSDERLVLGGGVAAA